MRQTAYTLPHKVMERLGLQTGAALRVESKMD